MSGYNSFDGASEEKKGEGTTAIAAAPPHLYSTPAVSAPLITAFGLPTLIECEQPSSSSTTAEPGTADAEEKVGPPSPQFTSLRGGRNRSLSLPVSPTSVARGGDPWPPPRSLSKSLFGFGGCTASSDDDLQSLGAGSINAYTYRVRTTPDSISSTDEHRLRFLQNADGTYSHATTATTTMMQAGDNEDDVSESDTGLLLGSAGPKASVSLDAVTNLEETMTRADGKGGVLLPGDRPSVPEGMLHPEFARTAPPLKLWPLAVLVFYNVSGGPFGIEPSIRAGG